ncbi:crotonase/enoyl-CoA hydratase family protein [Nocardia salmonicida]|uniref:crotonase/enoyl-CoA hydratase family protein n=1 Tax=Nocardia salmonicida TaxID=53431 RepID=UPI003410E694
MTPITLPTSDVVRVEARGHIAVVTIERPDAMNAVNAAVAGGIGAALEWAEQAEEIRVLVLTGSGESFCAGADLKALGRGESLDAPGHPEWGFAGYVRHPMSIPTIAAVNGFALGGGTELVLASDLAVMDPSARMGLPEVKRGLIAAAGGVLRLPRQVPLKQAMEIALTGDPIDASRATGLGLVNSVSEPGKVVEEAVALAQRIAVNSPVSVRESKKVMQRSAVLGSDWETVGWDVNARAAGRVLRSADFKEGLRAFAEKRHPEWAAR